MRLNRAESSSSSPLFCREFVTKDRALSRFWVPSTVPQGPGFAPSPSAQFLLGQVPQGDVTFRAPGASRCVHSSGSCVGWSSSPCCHDLEVWQESLSPAVSEEEHTPRFQQVEGCGLPMAMQASCSSFFYGALLHLCCLLGCLES